ncbi:MAG: hypothetical protein IT228_11195 [Flavobacteriales bacterium]|nr:hypothetical protein [Flavobacteriales bacterium]MCC6577897.1 hypothetical protein [Flavobacteriales bacterium]NUQ14555.1 hypothetical protein [Flavobacteriales bacterium]
MLRRAWPLLLLLPLLLVLPADGLAQGCAMCKATVEGQQQAFGGEQNIGRGLNSGILYLMAAPYVLLFLLFRKKIVGFFKEFANAEG